MDDNCVDKVEISGQCIADTPHVLLSGTLTKGFPQQKASLPPTVQMIRTQVHNDLMTSKLNRRLANCVLKHSVR